MQERADIFTEAFEAHADELFRHASMRLSDRERAVELVQDSFVRAFEYVRRGGTIEDMRPFLYRTLRNLIIDEYRKHKTVSLEGLLGEDESSVETLLPTDDSNTLESAMDRIEAARVLELVSQLPELYKEAILLRFVEGLSLKEIAQALGESENVVSVRVHRALKKLRTLAE